MKRSRKKYFLIFLVTLFSCGANDKDCSPKFAVFAEEKSRVEGCLNKGLEEGEWKFFDGLNALTEKGNFEKGIRVGNWYYPQNKADSIIEWKKFTKTSNGLSFSVPNRLEIVEEDSTFIKFSNADSTKLFNLVIAFSDVAPALDIEQFHIEAQNEMINRGGQFKVKRQQLVTESGTFNYDEYLMKIPGQDSTRLLNFYAIAGDKFFEFDCRYPKNFSATANIIFFSVLGNIFFNSKRVFNPFEKIRAIKKLSSD